MWNIFNYHMMSCCVYTFEWRTVHVKLVSVDLISDLGSADGSDFLSECRRVGRARLASNRAIAKENIYRNLTRACARAHFRPILDVSVLCG